MKWSFTLYNLYNIFVITRSDCSKYSLVGNVSKIQHGPLISPPPCGGCYLCDFEYFELNFYSHHYSLNFNIFFYKILTQAV